MYVVTNKRIHFNVKYYDINAAGPTLLKDIYDIDLLDLPKEERNIRYGQLMKYNPEIKVIPRILLNYSKLLCKRNNGILYTVDSVVSRQNITLDPFVQTSIFTYKVEYDFSILVIDRSKTGYIGLTKDNRTIIKGNLKQYISQTLAYKILTTGFESLQKFKLWLKRCKPSELISNGYLVIDRKMVKITNINNISLEPNREFYFRKSLQFLDAITMWKF